MQNDDDFFNGLPDIRCSLDGRGLFNNDYVLLPCGHAYCHICMRDMVVTAAIVGRPATCKECGQVVPGEYSYPLTGRDGTAGALTGLRADFETVMIQTASPSLPGAPVPAYVRELKTKKSEAAAGSMGISSSYNSQEAGRKSSAVPPTRFMMQPHSNKLQEADSRHEESVPQIDTFEGRQIGGAFAADASAQGQQTGYTPFMLNAGQQVHPLPVFQLFDMQGSYSSMNYLGSGQDMQPAALQHRTMAELLQEPPPFTYQQAAPTDYQAGLLPAAAPYTTQAFNLSLLNQPNVSYPQPLQPSLPYPQPAQALYSQPLQDTRPLSYQQASLQENQAVSQNETLLQPIPCRLNNSHLIQSPFARMPINPEPVESSRSSLPTNNEQYGAKFRKSSIPREHPPQLVSKKRDISLLAGLKFCFKGSLANQDKMEEVVTNSGGIVTGGGYKHTNFGVVGPDYKVPGTWAANNVKVLNEVEFWRLIKERCGETNRDQGAEGD